MADGSGNAKGGTCKHMSGCPMFRLFTLSGTLAVWQTNYCSSDFERCERYKRACLGEAVPENLLPNGKLLKK